jgi:DNA-binding NarL/FixJ family response regulator
MDSISVLLVDDHALFVEALQARLSREIDLCPVRVATSGAEALAMLNAGTPDVAVLDVSLQAEDGVALAARIARVAGPSCRVIMMTEMESSGVVVDALRAGARAWVPKTTDVDQLLRVIRGVICDEVWIPPALLGDVLPQLLGDGRPATPEILAGLTGREAEILQCMVDGLPRPAIAILLGVTPNTVRTHTQNLLAKLGAHSTLEAVSIALRHGMRASDV